MPLTAEGKTRRQKHVQGISVVRSTVRSHSSHSTCAMLLLLCAVCLHLGVALELSNSPPHQLVEVVCWEDAPCHTVYTDEAHDILYDEMLLAHPDATVRDVLVECAICNMTGTQKSCYRTATMIDFQFSTTMANIGKDMFGLDPSGCGETQTYCWHNISCATQTATFLEELQQNVYASPTMELECTECNTGEHSVSCITGVCMSCFFPDNPLRMMWEGLDAFGDNVGGGSCEEVVGILEDAVGISAAKTGPMGTAGVWRVVEALGIAVTVPLLAGSLV